MASISNALLSALSMAFAMGWEILWPLILGFALSGVVQAVVTKAEMSRLLPDSSPRSIVIASALGAASSSCSYAAVALARSVFRKGAISSRRWPFSSPRRRREARRRPGAWRARPPANRPSAGGHGRERRALGRLVDRREPTALLLAADERVEVARERGVPLLHRVGAVLHVQRLGERGLLQLPGVRLAELGEDVVLHDRRVGPSRRHLQERGRVIGVADGLRLREQLLRELLVGRPLERGDRLVRAVVGADRGGRRRARGHSEDQRVGDVGAAEGDRLLPLRGGREA